MRHLWQIPKWVMVAIGFPFWLLSEGCYRAADYFHDQAVK